MSDAVGAIASNPSELTLGTTYTDNLGIASDKDYFQLPQQSKNSKVTIDFTGLSSSTNDLLNGTTGNQNFHSNSSDAIIATTTRELVTVAPT